MASPNSRDLMAQIARGWDAAKAQLDQLKGAVHEAEKLGALRSDLSTAHRRRDLAFQQLGEAVWQVFLRGELRMPNELEAPLQAVRNAELQRSSKASEISALLDEGTETARRLSRKSGLHSAVASGAKKR